MRQNYQLKNKLRVLLFESHKAPVVSVQLWVKNGSADEKPAEAGLSHFIEHLVFKGTEKYGMGEIAQKVEAHGGELNAYTSFDQTVFYVNISSRYLNVAIDVISEMMACPLFDEQELNNEREVVVEEIKRDHDSPSRQASQLLFSSAFKKHPYGRPIIGYEKIIRETSRKKIVDFFKKRYVAPNMLLVVAGDISPKSLKKEIDQKFSRISSKSPSKINRKKESNPKNFSSALRVSKFKDTQAFVSWPIPNVKHKDVPALDVLAFILGQGDSSRLVMDLRVHKSLARSVGASSFTPQDPGLFTISVACEEKNLAACLDEISNGLSQLLIEGPSQSELDKAKTCFASEQIYSLESVEGIARKAGSLQFYTGDPEYFKVFLKKVAVLSAKDIHRVLIKYLNPQKTNLCIMSPLSMEQQTRAAENFREKYFKDFKNAISNSKKIKIKKTSKKSPRIKLNLKFHLDSKNREHKIVRETDKNRNSLYMIGMGEIPTTAVSLGVLAGVRMEPESLAGISELMSRVWVTQTKTLTEQLLYEKIDSMASSISAFSGRQSCGLSMEYLSGFSDQMWELFEDIILNPSWNSEIISREASILKNQIRLKADNPAQVCAQHFMKYIFENHPYSKDTYGSPESIDRIGIKEIQDYYSSCIYNGNIRISTVGDFDSHKIIDRFNRISKGLGRATHKIQIPEIAPLKENKFLFQHLDKEQTHIIYGFRGLAINDPNRHALQVLQAILSGQGGRLFLELRDKNSLAYSVSPIKFEGIGAGYFGVYIGCSPEKSKKAIQMMREELEKLVHEPVAERELMRAKTYLVGRHDLDLQRKQNIAQGILFEELYGMSAESYFTVDSEIDKVTSKDIQDLAKKIFSGPAIVSVVGSKEMEAFFG